MAMKGYSTFPRAPEPEPRHQMQFNVILRTLSIAGRHTRPTDDPIGGGVLHLCRGSVGVFYCSSRQGHSTCDLEAAQMNVQSSLIKKPNKKNIYIFFVQAFKIVVDTWKFNMLLLYILWDDWPIFMISGSNEQLQQELEYTLLKPDYHSWWISKTQSGREDTLEELYAIKFCFKLGKNATETYGMPQTAFGPSFMNQASVF